MRSPTTLSAFFLSVLLSAQTYQLSPVFGTNGAVHVDVAPGGDVANAHALLPNGKLLLAGHGYDFNLNSYHVGLLQLDTVCGAPDPAFGNGGAVARTYEQRTQCLDIALQPDGRIVGCGMIAPNNFGSEQWPGVFRFLPDGSVDSTFNGTGYHRLLFNTGTGHFTGAFVNTDGSITCSAAGFFTGIGAVRFTSGGALDTGFGSGGTAALPLPNSASSSKGTGLMRPDGSVVSILIMWTGVGNDYALALAQFDAFGVADTSFGVGGLAVSPVIVNNSTTEGGMGASLLPDGRILVSCMATDVNGGFLMARFLADGTVDSTYATNGVSVVTTLTPSIGASHELLTDGSTLQFGSVNSKGAILKRDSDGQVMIGFGTNGFVDAVTGPSNEEFLGGFTLPSGRIIGYGSYTGNEYLVARLTTDPIADALPSISLVGTQLVTAGSGSFQWYLDGTLLVGETGSTHTPLQNGVYTVTMTISSDCVYTSDPFNMLSVGISENQADPIRLLNNPVADVLVVRNDSERTPYTLLDARGAWIGSGYLLNGYNVIDTSGLASGMYLLNTPEQADRVQRVMKP